MKYCPYCGASLLGGAASFCAECGKKIPAQAEDSQSKSQLKRKKNAKKWKEAPTRHRKPHAEPRYPASRKKNPMDVNYDGYYDDIKPMDAGEQEERMDPELVKKVAILLAGALVLILAAVMLMTLL